MRLLIKSTKKIREKKEISMQMHIKKQPRMLPELVGVPADKKVLVFGRLNRHFSESEGLYLVFLADKNANISPLTEIFGVEHFQCFENEKYLKNVHINFSAFRNADGGYCFESKWRYRYDFFPPDKKIDHPTGFLNYNLPITTFFMRIID